MNIPKPIYGKLCLVLAICLCTMLPLDNAFAFGSSDMALTAENCRPVEIDATIMHINVARSFFIIAEKTVVIADLHAGGQEIKTRLMDKKEKPIGIGDFKPGQRVYVNGFQTPDGDVIALTIKKLKKHKNEKNKRHKAMTKIPEKKR